MMWWDGSGWGAGTWVLMVLMMTVFTAAVIATVVWSVTALRRGGAFSAGQQRPDRELERTTRAERMLDERFARGDLTEDEYLEQRSLLHRD